MTDELRSLLRRVHAAGGPVEVNASGEVAFVQLSPRCEVTLDLEADSREQPRNDALLIHALRLDAVQRGAHRHDARNYGANASIEPQVAIAGYQIYGGSAHVDEACAWLLAWLDAFEAAK